MSSQCQLFRHCISYVFAPILTPLLNLFLLALLALILFIFLTLFTSPKVYPLSSCDLLNTASLRKAQWEAPAGVPGVGNISEMGDLVAGTLSSILGLVVYTDSRSPRDFWKAFQRTYLFSISC